MENMASLAAGDSSYNAFKALDFHRRDLKDNEVYYRVYSSPAEFVEIKAESASDALKKSDIETPFKILCCVATQQTYLLPDMLIDMSVVPHDKPAEEGAKGSDAAQGAGVSENAESAEMSAADGDEENSEAAEKAEEPTA